MAKIRLFEEGGSGGSGGGNTGGGGSSPFNCTALADRIAFLRTRIPALRRDYNSTILDRDRLVQQQQQGGGGPMQVITLQDQINELNALLTQLAREIQSLETELENNEQLYNERCRDTGNCPPVDGVEIIYAREEAETVQQGDLLNIVTRYTCPPGYTRVSPAECNMCRRQAGDGGGFGGGGGLGGGGGGLLEPPLEDPDLTTIPCDEFYSRRRQAILNSQIDLAIRLDAEYNRRCINNKIDCPPGSVYNVSKGICDELIPDPCSCGETWDIPSQRCVTINCPDGSPQRFINGVCGCPTPTCPPGQTYNSTTQRCEGNNCNRSESECQAQFPRKTLDRSICKCVDPECRLLDDYGNNWAPPPNSSRPEDLIEPVPVERFVKDIEDLLRTSRNQRISSVNTHAKQAIVNVLNASEEAINNDVQYGWACSNYGIDQLAGNCVPFIGISSQYPIETSNFRVGNTVLVQFVINNAVSAVTGIPPGNWVVGSFGRLCKLIRTKRRVYTPPPSPNIPAPGDPNIPTPNIPSPDVPVPPPAPPPQPEPPTLPPVPVGKIYNKIKPEDIFLDKVEVVTEGLWSNNVGNLRTFHTCSTQYTASQRSHYVIYNQPCTSGEDCPEPQFDIAYGHDLGSGSKDLLGYDYLTPSNAIYGQYRGLCLESNQQKFNIAGQDTDSIYIVNVRRARMKDRLDEGNFELNLAHLSGSEFIAGGGSPQAYTGSNVTLAGNGKVLRLIDDSRVNDPTTTTIGEIYQLVSGSLEQGVYNSTNPHIYGLVYPRQGIIIISGDKLDLSASFGTVNETEVLGDNAYKLFTSISGAADFTDTSGDYLGFQGRKIRNDYMGHVFIRVPHSEFNHSNNPTYVTGSDGLIIKPFRGKNKAYITSIGIYNDNNELIAIGKLSRPVLKTATDEALFKVKFKYN